MTPNKRTLLFVFALAAAGGGARAQSVKVDADLVPGPSRPGQAGVAGGGEATHVPAQKFRRDYPAPANLDAFTRAYDAARVKLLARARDGLRTDVSLTELDGTVHQGYDEYFSSPPQRFREVRAAYENVIVGDINCSKTSGGSFKCEKIDLGGNYDFGLRKLSPVAILSVDESVVDCGGASCKSYVIDQADDIEMNDAHLVSAAPRLNHSVFVLVVRQDGLPSSFDEAHFTNGQADAPAAKYRFAYDKKVARFDLPDH